jgi:hypothetical protein
MPIPLICPCSAKLRVADHLQGQHIKCPRCGAFHAVGAANGEAVVSPGGGPASEQAPESTEAVLSRCALTEDERDALRDVLEEGEIVVWADRPDADAAFRFGWIFAGVFGVVAFVLLLVDIGILAMGPSDVVLFVIAGVLVLVVLALAGAGVAAPFYQRWRYGKTVYAFTNQRALAWACDLLGRVKLKTYPPSALGSMQCTARTSGLGSLIFGTQQIKRKDGQAVGVVFHGFFYIRNALAVEKLMHQRLIDPFMDKVYDE